MEKSEINKGVLFFNTGSSCLLRLFVSVFSLRRYYDGNIGVLLNSDDELNKEIEKNLTLLNVQTYYFNKPELNCKRNGGYTIKPYVLSQSPFDHTMFVDSDTIFCSKVSDFFDFIEKYDLVITPYKDWITTGRKINGRIMRFADLFSPEELKKIIEYKFAINTGVVGYSKNTKEFFEEWVRKTFEGQGRFIVDELIAQCICYKYKHYLADQTWNYSCRNIKFDTAKVIHFHGRKHARLHRCQSAMIWINTFIDFVNSGVIDKEFEQKIINSDRQVRKCKIYETYINV